MHIFFRVKRKRYQNRDLGINQFNQFSISSTRTKLNWSQQCCPSLSFYPKENPFRPVFSVFYHSFSWVCFRNHPELVLRLSRPSRTDCRLLCSFVKMCGGCRPSSCRGWLTPALPGSFAHPPAEILGRGVCSVLLPLQLRYGDISFHSAKVCHPDIPARSADALHLALPMS